MILSRSRAELKLSHLPLKVELAGADRAVRARHDTAEVALREAKALALAMEVETDEGRAAELGKRIQELVEAYGLGGGEEERGGVD